MTSGGGGGELRARKVFSGRGDTNGNADSVGMLTTSYEELEKIRGSTQEELGFIHWLFIFVIVASLYASAIFVDRRMPPVVPGNQHQQFSEERARIILNDLAGLGPRPSASHACEVEAVALLTKKIATLEEVIAEKGMNRLEMDVHHPSGCFDLKFLSSFTHCYSNLTNVVARMGPKDGPSAHSILINCHFDTLPDTPGASDDAVSCAIMLEVMEIYAHSTTRMENDIVFLFNGGEENFLQASHGFTTQHPWRYTVRAFINLEGTGSGGREMLFQAGPGDSWLLKAYLDNAPHPHCSVMAQEVFQSGVIPSDTDFRIFRDFGRISGIDVVYHRNGWLYHTEFDKPEFINEGAIQRAGENVLAVSHALIKSPYLKQPANFNEGNKWVFFDVVGLFTVSYEMKLGAVLNYMASLAVLFLLSYRVHHGVYTMRELQKALWHHLLCLAAMSATGLTLVGVICALDMTMTWYSIPELVFPIYVLPMINIGVWVHSKMRERYLRQGERGTTTAEMVHYDTVILCYSLLLFAMTFFGYAAAFLYLIHVAFPLLRDPLIYLWGKLGVIKATSCQFLVVTPRVVLAAQAMCMLPVMFFVGYAISLVFDFFVPVMGRLGNALNPEFVIMPLSLLAALAFVMFTNNLIYVSRRLNFLIRCSFALSIFAWLIIATTRVGWPYTYSDKYPRLRRIIVLHAKRTIYDFNGIMNQSDTGLFITSMDFRGVGDLPEHTFLQAANRPDCSRTKDEYCRLPYYTALNEIFPPRETRWVPVPSLPMVPRPLSVALLSRSQPEPNLLNISLVVRGGSDKTSLHITPLNGYKLKEWSFTPFDAQSFGHKSTYFVFLTYGPEVVEERKIWMVLEQTNPHATVNPNEKPSLELAAATHYTHGRYQNSETLAQLRSLIKTRRQSPHTGVGQWKWAMTMIGSNSEIIVHLF